MTSLDAPHGIPAAAAMVLVTSLFLMTPPVNAARILLVSGNLNSHVSYFTRLAVDLARLGHVTRLLAPSNARRPKDVCGESGNSSSSDGGSGINNFTFTAYPVDGDVPFFNSRQMSEVLVRIALSTSPLERFRLSMDVVGREADRHHHADCVRLMENAALMRDVRQSGFQFAIMDPIAHDCTYALPYSLGVPFASLSIPAFTSVYRLPRLPSFASFVFPSDRLSFLERLKTVLIELAFYVVSQKTSMYVEKYAPGKPIVQPAELFSKASLWFIMEDPSVGFPMPHMPNTASVGDLMAGRPGKPLPDDVERFMRASVDGGIRAVIVVSFGSLLDFVPDEIVAKFCEAFRRVGADGLRVIWKLRNSTQCGAENVLTLPWIPQNDLLADPRVRLFISHGGLNSIVESVYHAKPLVVFPVALDQPANAAAAESKGFAVRMDLSDFTPADLVRNIDAVLDGSADYGRRAEQASRILRDRPETPAVRMSRMIDHVISYGDRHLRTGAFELNVLQFWMFDVCAVIILAAVSLLATLVVLLRCVLRCFGNQRCGLKGTEVIKLVGLKKKFN